MNQCRKTIEYRSRAEQAERMVKMQVEETEIVAKELAAERQGIAVRDRAIDYASFRLADIERALFCSGNEYSTYLLAQLDRPIRDKEAWKKRIMDEVAQAKREVEG